MDHVKLMGWCRTCVTGMHMPAFAAAEAGLFAEQDIEVEFVGCAKARDYSISGFTTRPKAVAAGYADFALSGVLYLLAAQNELGGRLPVRFAAISHQRNPITAIVRADSELQTAEDLPGRRAARWSIPYYVDEYAGALAHLGLGAPEIVDCSEHIDEALASGEIDVMPTWMEMTQYHRKPEFPIRTIALDIGIYTTGLIAADRLAPELVARVRDAYAAGYELFRDQPALGVDGFRRQYPDISAEHIASNWAMHEPYAFGAVPAGSMDADRWRATIEHTAATHGLSPIAGERFYRPELLTPTFSQAAA
jgi:ABC-type nitrate/sulfonate/bicarbonate transport system substrate-binding protein